MNRQWAKWELDPVLSLFFGASPVLVVCPQIRVDLETDDLLMELDIDTT